MIEWVTGFGFALLNKDERSHRDLVMRARMTQIQENIREAFGLAKSNK